MRPSLAQWAAGLCTVAALCAEAQQAPPADIPAHNCVKPGEAPLQPTAEMARRYDKSKEAYRDCIRKYVDDLNARIQAEMAVVKAYEKAANAAVEEFNAWASEANAGLKK